ncbi:MAG: hypothetical protein LUD39_04355 [Opitutae bacterium]|nr:hypothetical protein [Opitutae bacterium]MCD8298971.1 hypothetical protein [Opitutae bacterium]
MHKRLILTLCLAATAAIFPASCAHETRVPEQNAGAQEGAEISDAENGDTEAREIDEAKLREFREKENKLLADARYADALDLCLENEMPDEANYIAECVMETQELEDYVRTRLAGDEDSGALRHVENDEVRYALARRLVRDNRPARAREFFPAELLPVFDEYAAAIRDGYNFDLSDEERAKQFWNAAMIVRENGDALFANFSSPDEIARREFVTDDEQARVESRDIRESVITTRRRAATLAQYAASLLPNNDERTARILVCAGMWLKARDAVFADTFYKLLAIRCPKTKNGQRCIELRWFPPETEWTREQVWDGVPEEENPAGDNADTTDPATTNPATATDPTATNEESPEESDAAE